MSASERHPRLDERDARVLDALVDAGLDPTRLGPLSAEDRRRADTIVRMLGLLEDYPVEDGDAALVDATLARVERFQRRQAERMQIDGDGAARWRLRLPDLVTLAAVLLILVSVTVPVATSVRSAANRAGCANNMRTLATALGLYAQDHDGFMPMAAGFPGGDRWPTFSNGDGLELLARHDYCEHGHLDCPGHGGTGPSYAYQVQLESAPMRWGLDGQRVVIGDLNPILNAIQNGRFVDDALIASPNHRGVGQNLLFGDGAVRWQVSPVVNGDNIWLPRLTDGTESLRRQAPAAVDPADAFLAQ